ncbi:MAG: hypothetical protein ABI904_19675 [Chloroflexota bacterium]
MKRFFLFSLVFLLVLSACAQSYALTPTVLPTETPMPATQPPTLEVVTQTPTSQSLNTTDWLSGLEVIGPANWSRLQLLKTFPAEMPLNHSAVAISADGKTMAVGSSSGAKIFFFDLSSGQLSRTVSINGVPNVDAYFNTLEYLPDGTLMANSDGPYAIYHIDAVGNVLSTWDGSSFALSADKKIMAHGTNAGTTLVDIASNTSLGSFEGGYALDFSFAPDGSKIAVNDAGVDYITTTIWDIASGTQLAVLNDMGNARFSPNNNFFAVTSYKENITPLKIFSPDGMTQLATLSVNEPNGLDGRPPVLSSDGSIIAAQIAKGSPVAWDTTDWQLLEPLPLEGELYSFAPDGRILVTRTPDGGILLWGVKP